MSEAQSTAATPEDSEPQGVPDPTELPAGSPSDSNEESGATAAEHGEPEPEGEGAHGGGHGPPAHAPGRAKEKPPGRLRVLMGEAWGAIRDTAQAIRFPNKHVRQISALFYLSLVGLVAVNIAWILYYRELARNRPHELTPAELKAQELAEAEAKKTEEKKRKDSTVEIGRFMADLQPLPGAAAAKSIARSGNRADINLFALCDSMETREYVEAHLPDLKDQMLGIFSKFDRDTLLSREGKLQVKRTLIMYLNSRLSSGKILELHFSYLLVK